MKEASSPGQMRDASERMRFGAEHSRSRQILPTGFTGDLSAGLRWGGGGGWKLKDNDGDMVRSFQGSVPELFST